MVNRQFLHLVPGVSIALALTVIPNLSQASVYVQTNLVSSVAGLAPITDPNLINPWGVASSATSPFWVSDQGSGLSTLYDGAGNINSRVVTIPGSSTPPSGPTGQVFNSTTGFVLPDGTAASFIFDTLNGTIAGWNGGEMNTAVTMATTGGAVYTGLALASSGGSNYLYAADSTGQIRIFSSSFAATTLAGNFTDPNAIAGYTPYNIQLIGSSLYVTYAELDARGNPITASTGYVDVFNTDGTFAQRLITGGQLDAPWGIALAPVSFGAFGGDLLVGNFGNGQINAFNATTGAYVGTIDGSNGQPLVNSGLWALDFRTGGTNVNTSALYFTAGINNQAQGLFGEITAAPEPGTVAIGAIGLAGLALLRRRKSA